MELAKGGHYRELKWPWRQLVEAEVIGVLPDGDGDEDGDSDAGLVDDEEDRAQW